MRATVGFGLLEAGHAIRVRRYAARIMRLGEVARRRWRVLGASHSVASLEVSGGTVPERSHAVVKGQGDDFEMSKIGSQGFDPRMGRVYLGRVFRTPAVRRRLPQSTQPTATLSAVYETEAMPLSRIEAHWIASKLLSEAEQERERGAQRRTAWLAFLFPSLAHIRPTERVAVLRHARLRAAREPWILWPTVVGWLLYLIAYVGLVRPSRPLWLYWAPSAVVVGNLLAQYLRTRVLLQGGSS